MNSGQKNKKKIQSVNIPKETMAAFPNDDYKAVLTYLKECLGADICSLNKAIGAIQTSKFSLSNNT